MPTIITDTAQMLCDKGAAPAALIVTSQSFVYIDEKLVATEKDKSANTNIPPFGICSLTQKNCMQQPTMWTDTTEQDTIDNNKELTDKSSCMCGLGGKISFQTAPQTYVESEK